MKTSGKTGIKKTSVSLNTRIKTLLDADQENVIAALVGLNTNFAKLRNPILRHLFARRVSVADACRIAKCDPDAFLKTMEELGFDVNASEAGQHTSKEFADRQEELADERTDAAFYTAYNVVTLDVRSSLAANQDPLKMIMKAIKELRDDECLKIVNTFEPVPLIELLADQGFTHHTEVLAPDLVTTWFGKPEGTDTVKIPDEIAPGAGAAYVFDTVLEKYKADQISYLDVRQLEMPLPMLRIMEQLSKISGHELLYVYHKKLPVFLLPELEKKGLSYAFKRKSETELDLLIFR